NSALGRKQSLAGARAATEAENLTSNGLDLRAKAIIALLAWAGCAVPRWRRSTSATLIRPLVYAGSAARSSTKRRWHGQIGPDGSVRRTWRPSGRGFRQMHRCS